MGKPFTVADSVRAMRRYAKQKQAARRRAHPPGKPFLTILNCSSGAQSTCILWMVLLGQLPRPEHFYVLNANPGMEDWRSYVVTHHLATRCAEQGIPFITAPGPNLYHDLVTIQRRRPERIDNPPFWTRNEDGSIGQLSQKCTREYKVRPMDRVVRRLLRDEWGIPENSPAIGEGRVVKWIGFAADEELRVKSPEQKYQRFEYPLIDLGMTRADVSRWFVENNILEPPRSVCNGCFAHGLESLKRMHDEQPENWRQAVVVDDALAYGLPGSTSPAYVSRTCVRLRELAAADFDLTRVSGTAEAGFDERDMEKFLCDEGVCFV